MGVCVIQHFRTIENTFSLSPHYKIIPRRFHKESTLFILCQKAYFIINILHTYKYVKICIIEVYLLIMVLKATSYINDAIIEKKSSINLILWYLM